MTPEQLKENKKLNDELRERREAGESLTIKHGKIITLVPHQRQDTSA